MRNSVFSALYVLAALLSTPLSAEQITKVAVLDYTKILSAFYADSAALRRIEKMKEVFAADVRRLQEEIQSLEEEKLEAENAGKSREALNIDKRIQDKKKYYQDFVRVRGNRIQQSSAKLVSDNELAKEILQEIQYVAETHGFSIVLKRSDPDLLWWNYEVDITELVLQRLMSRKTAN